MRLFKKAVREELLPSLVAIQSENSEDFTISISLGLSPEEHAAICGLSLSHRSTKELLDRYAKELESNNANSSELFVTQDTNEEHSVDEPKDDSGQMKLF